MRDAIESGAGLVAPERLRTAFIRWQPQIGISSFDFRYQRETWVFASLSGILEASLRGCREFRVSRGFINACPIPIIDVGRRAIRIQKTPE